MRARLDGGGCSASRSSRADFNTEVPKRGRCSEATVGEIRGLWRRRSDPSKPHMGRQLPHWQLSERSRDTPASSGPLAPIVNTWRTTQLRGNTCELRA